MPLRKGSGGEDTGRIYPPIREEDLMSEFDQQPLESPTDWLRRLHEVDTVLLLPEQRRVHTYYMAEAKRLLQEAQQKAKWDREK
jgi:hypothetical protein